MKLGWGGCLNLFLLNWAPFLRSMLAKVEKTRIVEPNLRHHLAVQCLSWAEENWGLGIEIRDYHWGFALESGIGIRD